MTSQEKDKFICEKLGICWHDDSKEVGGIAVGLCSKCGTFNPLSNPDFTSEAGRVQLLKLVRDKIAIGKRMNSEYMLDDTGKLRDAVYKWFGGAE